MMTPETKQYIEGLLNYGDIIIGIDPNMCENVPTNLMDTEVLVLTLGVRPTPDLVFSEDGIFAPISLNMTRYEIFIPWDAVRVVQNGEIIINPITEKMVEDHKPDTPKKKNHLSLVSSNDTTH